MASILLIDDDAIVRRDIKRALAREGHSLVEATGPEDGLRCARQHHPDLILLDIVMPGADGVSVLRKLSEDSATARIPVIVVSASGGPAQVAACLDEGAADHIAKPFSHQTLCSRVQACLKSSPTCPGVDTRSVGKVVSFLGAKGGVGTTTLALNVAVSLALEEPSVVLAEIRPQSSGLAILLNVHPQDDLGVLLRNPSALTDFYVRQLLARHPSGLNILFGPQDPVGELNEGRIGTILSAVSRAAEIVALDLSPDIDDANASVLHQSDLIVVVLDRELTSLRSAARIREQLSKLAIQRPVVAVVVNRSGLSHPVKIDEIRAALRCELLEVIPLAGDVLQSAAKAGQPIVQMLPQEGVSMAFRTTAELISREILATANQHGATSGLFAARTLATVLT